MIGICVMTRKTVLDDIGGVGSIKDYIAEDLALGKKAVKKGYEIGLGPIVYSSVGHTDFSDLVNEFKRAALSSGAMNFRVVVRSAVPISYIFGVVMILILKEFGWGAYFFVTLHSNIVFQLKYV